LVAHFELLDEAVEVEVLPSGDDRVQTSGFPSNGTAKLATVLPGLKVWGWFLLVGFGLKKFLVPLGIITVSVVDLLFDPKTAIYCVFEGVLEGVPEAVFEAVLESFQTHSKTGETLIGAVVATSGCVDGVGDGDGVGVATVVGVF
jgi:hypothetical protein